MNPIPERNGLVSQRTNHAELLSRGILPNRISLTLSEAIVIGLLRQGVRSFLTVLGHGSTEIGEVLRVYQQAGLLRTFGLRNEIEASHAATALRWVTNEKAAVVTSIGPGALQALAASIVPASDGIGVWYLLGDETTEDEGFNMQQIPKHEQGIFEKLFGTLGRAYSLHTPLALAAALNRGAVVVDHPYRAGPFFLLMPMNTQAAGWRISTWMSFPPLKKSDRVLPQEITRPPSGGFGNRSRIVVKVGGGGRNAGAELVQLLNRSGGALVHTPIAAGCIPYADPRNMTVGGSKGSLCGNFAMENADLLLAVGTRAVCQSDCSRTGYPQVKRVINVNADPEDASHYNRTLALVGNIRATLARLNQELGENLSRYTEWLENCAQKKKTWQALKQDRFQHPVLEDDYWEKAVLTQPAAIKIATDWARSRSIPCFFDAGDVQANGFQIVEDEHPNQTFTETGASYMGFAVSALLSTGIATKPFYALALTGDGSFTMNPQILIDGIEHGAQGCILLLDNGRMGAITGLQIDQYGQEFATANTIQVDYLSWAKSIPGVLALDGGNSPDSLSAALEKAGSHPGLSFIHVPVYFGPDPLGGMGVYGRWNVGDWCENVQSMRHQIGL